MFGKDFWKVLRIIYLVLKALIEMVPPNGKPIEDFDDPE